MQKPNLISQDPDIEVYLRHPDGVGGGAGKLKTLIVLISIALRGEHHVVTRGRLQPLAIPTRRELDVDFKL